MNKLPCNPWLSIWRQPRKTIRSLVEKQVSYGFLVLSFICGLPMAFQFVILFELATGLPLLGSLLFVLILAPLLGMLWLSIMGVLLFWTGKILRGKASFLAVRSAFAWSQIVNVWMIIGFCFLVIFFGAILFNGGVQNPSLLGSAEKFAFFSSIGVHIIAYIYGVVLLVACLAEVQKFGLFRSFLNCLMSVILLLLLTSGVNYLFFHS